MIDVSDLNPEKIKTSLKSSVIGSEILVFGEVASTNDLARDRLAKNSPEGLTVVADSQTRGRGRLGRAWRSAPGLGLYFSVLLRPRLDARRLPLLALMASVAVADAIGEFAGATKLKWPNDVLLNGKKTCGILAEYCKTESSEGVVVGIGVNVNHRLDQLPEEFRSAATSLFIENGEPVNRAEVLRSILERLDAEYRDFLSHGEELLVEKWTERTDMFGKQITVTRGPASFRGTAMGLDRSGNLAVLTEDGRRLSFESGEVTLNG